MTAKQPIINVDWLQIHVDTSHINTAQRQYQLRTLEGVRTKTFAKVTEIRRDNRLIATLHHQPHSPKLPKGCGVLKIENYILYTDSRQNIISQLIRTIGLTTISTTRIDICGDFQQIADRDPQQLVTDIIKGDIRKIGHARQSIIGNETITAYGKREWQYLRYGSRSSRISAYLYNKSKELRDDHDKPYIRAIWASNGLAIKKRDTWRLEFSIKGRDMKYISTETGEILPQDYRYYLSGDVLTDIYRALCNHYFAISLNDHTRASNCTPISLWRELGGSNILVKYIDPTRHNNRADKIFLRKLLTIGEELTDTTTIDIAHTLADRYMHIKNLRGWATEQNLLNPQTDRGELNL